MFLKSFSVGLRREVQHEPLKPSHRYAAPSALGSSESMSVEPHSESLSYSNCIGEPVAKKRNSRASALDLRFSEVDHIGGSEVAARSTLRYSGFLSGSPAEVCPSGDNRGPAPASGCRQRGRGFLRGRSSGHRATLGGPRR